MTARQLHFGSDARQYILRGSTHVGRLAALTLGPDARTVLIERPAAAPLVAASGYQVALNVALKCPVAQLGAQAMRNLAWEMLDRWGDGTATAICLSAALFTNLSEAEARGLGRRDIGAQVHQTIEVIVDELRASAEPAGDDGTLNAIARAAAAGDEVIADIVSRAAAAVGARGYIDVMRGGDEDTVDLAGAMEFESGWLSPAFATEADGKVLFDGAHVVVFDGQIQDFSEIGAMLDVFARLGKPLLFVASSIGRGALDALAANVRRSGAKIAAMRAPGEGDWRRFNLGDLAAATGATVLGDECGYTLKNIRPDLLGFAERIEMSGSSTRFIGGKSTASALDFRKGQIRGDIKRSAYLSLDLERHQKRLARLSTGIATVRIGGRFEMQVDQRLAWARNAVRATVAARQEGTVRGGGIALKDVARSIGPRGMFSTVLLEPSRAISANCGRDVAWRRGSFGDSCSRSQHSLRDPCSVLVDGLRRAAATALSLASTDVSVTPLQPFRRTTMRAQEEKVS